MKWDEIEQQLTEHVRSNEHVGISVTDEQRNRVWANVFISEKKRRSVKYVWLAAASVALFLLSGLAFYISKFDKMKSENVALTATVRELQESNSALKFRLEHAPAVEVTEKTRLIVKTRIVYKTIEKQVETPVSEIVAQTKDIEPSESHALPELTGLAPKPVNDSVAPLKVMIRETIEPKSNIGNQSDSINHDWEFKPLLSETTKLKWFRLRFGLGSYMSEPVASAWKVAIYSR
jgi:hypothetical protein